MKRNDKFYICEHCGNIAEKLVDGGAPLVCCGERMKELIPGTVEASREKHIPVVSVDGSEVTVRIGSVDHPMTAEHSILWVYLVTDRGRYLRHLDVGEAPVAKFNLIDGERVEKAYAYCNLHGLWVFDIN